MSRRCGVRTAKGDKGLGAREPLLGGGRGEPCGEIPKARIRSVRVCVCGARCEGLEVLVANRVGGVVSAEVIFVFAVEVRDAVRDRE